MNSFFNIRTAYGAAAVIALAYFAVFVFQRALNIPFHDDIFDVLLFTMDFSSAQGFKESFNVLFLQHNEHRTAASRLMYYAFYQLEGEVNFRSLSFVANMAMPAIVLVFMLGARTRADMALIGLVGVLLLCNPRAYNQIFWPTSAFAFFNVYAYALLALYFLRKNMAIGLPLGILFATASTYSLASGKVIWIAGSILLAWQVWGRRSRPVWHLLVWGSSAAAVLILYGYESPSLHTVSWLLEQFWIAPRRVMAYTLGILGSGFSFEYLPAALTIGVLSCTALAYIVMQDAKEGSLNWIHAFALFVVLSAVALAMGRAHYSHLDYVLEGRYSFPSVVFHLNVFVLACNRGLLRVFWVQPIIVVLAVALSMGLYRVYTPKVEMKVEQRLVAFDRGAYLLYGVPHDRTRDIVLDSIERGFYVPPPRSEPRIRGTTKKF